MDPTLDSEFVVAEVVAWDYRLTQQELREASDHLYQHVLNSAPPNGRRLEESAQQAQSEAMRRKRTRRLIDRKGEEYDFDPGTMTETEDAVALRRGVYQDACGRRHAVAL